MNLFQAIEKLIENPISSSISYKNGDDNKGMIEYPIITICPSALDYFTLFGPFDNHCRCGGTSIFNIKCKSEYQWAKVFDDCYKNTRYVYRQYVYNTVKCPINAPCPN